MSENDSRARSSIHLRRSSSPVNRRWTPLGVLRRGWRVLCGEGPRSLWFKILGEICYRRVMVLDLPLDTLRRYGKFGISMRFDMLTEQNVEDYRSLRPDADPDEVRRRLREGLFCGLGRHQGEVVYASWSASGRARIDYLDLETGLAPGVLYTYQGYVKPAFRHRGVGSEIVWQGGCLAQERGYSRIVIAVMPENVGAVRFHLKNGYRMAGWIQTFWLGPWRRNRLVMHEGAPPLFLV